MQLASRIFEAEDLEAAVELYWSAIERQKNRT
jgi:hypothetical protein